MSTKMQYIHDDMMSQNSLSSSSSTYSSSTSSSDDQFSTVTSMPYTLHQVLSNPKLLCAFECFLRQSWSHESLLFIEAITQLKHEDDPKAVEGTLHRIYKTFLARGSPMELNVTTQDQVRDDIRTLQWAIVDKVAAVTILEETETQVLDMLNIKLAEFLQTMDLPMGNVVSPATIQKQQVSVVVIGGGFTGFTVASILDQMPRFYVTLIDTKDSFEYTPGIVKKLVNPDQSSSLRVRHDAYVRNGKVIIGYAEDLSSDGKTVSVNGEVINFDYLVIATGSAYSSHLKSTDTSSLYRMSGLEESYFELLKARKVLIIGGGLVGCELASEISQHQFPGAHPKKEVTLVDSHSNVVNRSDARQQSMANKYLTDLGVEIVCNEKIIDFNSTNENSYLGSSGRVYAGYDKVFVATGTRPNSNLLTSSSTDTSFDDCIDAWGRIKVKSTLQIDHWRYKHIFAGGDVTNVVEEKTGYAATISGVCIARNICRIVKGKAPLKQGTKGTLPAPDKPLHGMLEHGGIGKQNLNSIKKRFSFLNPSWAALKYFDEQQFLKIVQGQGSINASQVLGRLPRKLALPSDSSNGILRTSQTSYSRSRSQVNLQPSTSNSAYSTISSRISTLSRQASFSSSSSSGSRARSSNQSHVHSHHHHHHHSSQHHFDRANSRLSALKHQKTHSQLTTSSSSIMKNRHVQQASSLVSRSNSTITTATSTSTVGVVRNVKNQSQKKNVKPVEDLLFEHFTYGGEDIKLFASNRPSTSCSSPSPISPSINDNYDTRSEMKQRTSSQLMSYDREFQLSPPPPAKRRASITTSFKSMSFCSDNKQPQSVKLTKTPSFSSIIQHI